MRYRLTCLTPLLVGDGRRLSPVDYMVWKDQVNVLDQRRIFRLLSKGPRLDGYLNQLKRADKLDFASWGGFAQNFADRRVPFENPAFSAYWQRAAGDSLHIPTFASGLSGAFLPGSAIKGVLRTGFMAAGMRPNLLNDVAARFQAPRPPRHPAEPVEEQLAGTTGGSRMRVFSIADSAPVDRSVFKVYLLRVATLEARGANGGYGLGWKVSPRGSVDSRRIEDSTPAFAEMAAPGAVFEGSWRENPFFSQPEVYKALRWGGPMERSRLFRAANAYAGRLLALHSQYAGWTGLAPLAENIASLQEQLSKAEQGPAGQACLLSIGWGSGLLAKTPFLDTGAEEYRKILQQVPLFERAIKTGMPFPKTRRIVFSGNRPSALPGWALLEVLE
jgi:CRISPR-associated protein Csm5